MRSDCFVERFKSSRERFANVLNLNDLGERKLDMGGWGSGWQGSKKVTVERCLVLSVKELARAGLLKPGCPSGSWCWRSGNETVATVKLDLVIDPDKGTIWLMHT